MKINIVQIFIVFDPNKNREIIYGISSDGAVYWYRNWDDENKTEGWVPCVMELSQIKNTQLEKND
jgi:hypothetical protein